MSVAHANPGQHANPWTGRPAGTVPVLTADAGLVYMPVDEWWGRVRASARDQGICADCEWPLDECRRLAGCQR